MNKKNILKTTIYSILITSLILVISFTGKTYSSVPSDLYKVYLDGKTIGLVNDKESLYTLIDNEQEYLKDEYKVEKIYPPKNLEVTPVKTYNTNVLNVSQVYNTIKSKETFTIEGYEITIEKEDPIVFNVLRKKDFDEAIKKTVESFVDSERLEKYINNTQDSIENGGSKINNISINEEISIKKTLISTKDTILTNANDITKYLLFGTLKAQETYTIKAGETLENVAYNNKLNVSEFLIINPDIVSENALLFPGQVVNVGFISPLISIVVDETQVEQQAIKYETTVKYDNTMDYGTTVVKQEGKDGITKAEFEVRTINGFNTQSVTTKTEQVLAPVEQIIVKGGSSTIYVGDSTYWAWPTLSGYRITSGFGWRTINGRIDWHEGVDIAHSHKSPIFAIQNGTVSKVGYISTYGNYVIVDHHNGYKSIYEHLTSYIVKEGDTVTKGSTIGFMGNTGYSFGTHLHLGVEVNGKYINPLSIYR